MGGDAGGILGSGLMGAKLGTIFARAGTRIPVRVL
jgi:3-hydroxyacyl-CoA dehydrogenase